jgi:hypothetical protein
MFDDRDSKAGRLRLAPRRHKPAAVPATQLCCDRCHVAVAQVEVVTAMGSVLLCRHHYHEHGAFILAAGHRVRNRSGQSAWL